MSTQPHDPIEGLVEQYRRTFYPFGDNCQYCLGAFGECKEVDKKSIELEDWLNQKLHEAYSLGQHAGLSGNIKNLDSVTVTSEIPQSVYNAIFEKGRVAGVREAILRLPAYNFTTENKNFPLTNKVGMIIETKLNPHSLTY